MKFPRKLWIKISNKYIKESMYYGLAPEYKNVTEEQILEFIINRIVSAERRTDIVAAKLLLHVEGLDLV